MTRLSTDELVDRLTAEDYDALIAEAARISGMSERDARLLLREASFDTAITGSPAPV